MKKILLGISVWGKWHTDVFLNYCIPSLMAEGNLPALAKERQIYITLHTDKESFKRLFPLALKYNLRVKVDVTNEDKYLQLGRHQHQDLREAKKLGADYHLLMPDFIYSENCFAGILKAVERGHKAIVRLVMSAVSEAVLPELDRSRSAIDLSTLALNNIHPGIRNWLVTEKGYPKTHVMVWVGENTLRMCSPHCSPVYIANEAIHLTDSDSPLDGILDKIIIGDIYCSKPEDGIVIIEVSPLESRKPQYDCIALKDFCNAFKWDTKNSPRQLAIFQEETVDSIHSETTKNNYWDEKDIARMKQMIYNVIQENMR